jgi:hypothetical protein
MTEGHTRWRVGVTDIIIAICATILVVVVAFFIGMVPDVPDMIREPVALAMLRHSANKPSFERFLKISGASWHNGYGYQPGEAFTGFDVASRSRCTVECGSVVQAAFTKTFGICIVQGDVVSARYDKNGKLRAWNSSQAVDGC